MDWTEIVITAMTTVLGGGVGVLATHQIGHRGRMAREGLYRLPDVKGDDIDN